MCRYCKPIESPRYVRQPPPAAPETCGAVNVMAPLRFQSFGVVDPHLVETFDHLAWLVWRAALADIPTYHRPLRGTFTVRSFPIRPEAPLLPYSMVRLHLPFTCRPTT